MLCPSCGKLVGEAAVLCESCAPLQQSRLEVVKAEVESRRAAQILPAGFWLRWFAYLIDGVLLSSVYWLFVKDLLWKPMMNLVTGPVFLQIMTSGAKSDEKLPVELQAQLVNSLSQAFALLALMILLWVVVHSVYHAVFESSSARASLGKLAMGLYVVDDKAKQVLFLRALWRNLAKYISSLILDIGYLMAGFTSRKQALHDILASCLVLKSPKVSGMRRFCVAIFAVFLFLVHGCFSLRSIAPGDIKQLKLLDALQSSQGEPSQTGKEVEQMQKELEKLKSLSMPSKQDESYVIDRFGNKTKVVIKKDVSN